MGTQDGNGIDEIADSASEAETVSALSTNENARSAERCV